MMSNLTIRYNSRIFELSAGEERSILQIMQENGLYISAICGGHGICGKCKVRFLKGEPEISKQDRAYFSEAELIRGFRLACTARLLGDAEISVESADEGFKILDLYKRADFGTPDNFKLQALDISGLSGSISRRIRDELGVTDFNLNALRKISGIFNHNEGLPYGNSRFYALTCGTKLVDVYHEDSSLAYGIAIDIGTTTICFELINLLTGEAKANYSRLNSQRKYGADVISRIKAVGDGKLMLLRDCVIQDIVEGINQLLSRSGIEECNIFQTVIGANTTMIHILLGISCESLGVSPFIPTVTEGLELRLGDILGTPNWNWDLRILPSISAYVGGDIVSGIFFCDVHHKKSLFVDIGTNCEMAVANGEAIICSAAAAGPAFEGGNISCGIGSVPGAIYACRYENSRFVYETIGTGSVSTTDDKNNVNNKSYPKGICGSGLMDAVACMLENGMLDESGRLNEEYCAHGVEIAPGISLTQRDIRELQLAKSAMRAGIEVLLKTANMAYQDIQAVYLSGSFGYNLNIRSAVAIGLIPEELSALIIPVGNSALGGCARTLLDKDAFKSISEIGLCAQEINLSEASMFNELFAEHMLFIYTDMGTDVRAHSPKPSGR